MKRSILFISLICLFLTCGCNKKNNSLSTDVVDTDTFYEYYSNETVDYYNVEKDIDEVKNVVNEENTLNNNKQNSTQNSNQTTNIEKNDSVVDKKESNNSQITETREENNKNDTIDNSKPKEDTTNETQVISNDNSVDESNMDYPIHKGRIDCNDVESCVSRSIPIQVKFKKSISNAFYVEVIAKNDATLGYFIQYVFVEYNYGSYDKCSSVGDEIKQTLSDRVVGYDCTSEGGLKVKTNY